MWHKAEWMGHQMRLGLTRVGLLVKLVNRFTTKGAPSRLEIIVINEVFCLYVSQRPNEWGIQWD